MKTWDLKHSIAVRSFGVTVRIISNSPDILAEAAPVITANIPGCTLAESTEPSPHTLIYRMNPGRLDAVYKDGLVFAVRRRREHALKLLSSQVRECIAEYAPDHVFIHAGVVAVGGRAIIMPAQSFHGKTTLTAELVRQGATYYSDEFAIVDRSGRIVPFSKDLSMRGILPGKAQVDITVESIGGTSGFEPAEPGLLLFAEYSADGEWDPKLLTPGEGFLELVKHTVPIRHNPQLAMPALRRIVDSAAAFKTARGEAGIAAASVLGLLDTFLSAK